MSSEIRDFNDLFCRPPTFCDECGELLDFELIKDENIICQRCGGEIALGVIKEHYIETTDTYDQSRLWVNKLKNKEDKLRAQQKVKRTVISDKCPKCGYGQMYYYTIQIRSADEGSTVFYECVKCHFKYNQNN